ncbi:MAG: DUF11 domain-containing protein [Erysipelotrichaceae bacterium]|nr:DUF11 domain-containing protein [Erysipelotrichaceae bacterium]
MRYKIKKILRIVLITTIVFSSFYGFLLYAENIDTTKDETLTEQLTINNTEIFETEIDNEINEENDNEENIMLDEIKDDSLMSEELQTDLNEEQISIENSTEEIINNIVDDTIEYNDIEEYNQLIEINELFEMELNSRLDEDDINYIVSGLDSPFQSISLFNSIFINEEETSYAVLNNFEISGIYDGTPGFDEDDNPGNDSGYSNKIVRSYDKIVYRTAYSTISEDLTSSVYNGSFTFKAILPVSENVASWDLNAMGWLENASITINNDSSILDGVVQINNQIVSPRVGSINWVVSVNGAVNNTEIPSPIFSMYVNNSSLETVGESVFVSAMSNVNARLEYEGDYNQNPVFSLLLELIANSEGKGMKGQEILDINQDINIKIKTDSNQKINFVQNNHLTDKNIIIRNLPYDNSGLQLETLFNKIYNGGQISVSQTENILNIKISDYSFDSLFNKVTHNSSKNNEYDGQDYNDDRYPFGAYILSLEDPGQSNELKVYSLEINSLQATSISNEVVNDFLSNDNKDTYIRGIPQGGGPGMSGGPVNIMNPTIINPTTKDTHSLIKKDADRNLPPDYKVYPGELVKINQSAMMYKSPNREYIETYWGLLKFDTNMFEVLMSKEEYSSPGSYEQPSLKDFYWIGKNDKAGWISEEEMFNAHINDIRLENGYKLFISPEDAIDNGYVVVGFLSKSVFENPDYVINFSGPAKYPALRVKADALYNKETNQMYENNDPNRVGLIIGELEAVDFKGNIYKRENVYNSLGDDLDMYLHFKDIKLGMIKATYDLNGDLISPSKSNAVGNRNGNYTHTASLVGASFYIQPYNTYINKHISQKLNDIDQKEVFNLDLNQKEVFFNIESGTSSPVRLDTLDTIVITEIIPKELNPINTSTDIEEKWGIVYDAIVVQDSTTNGKAGIVLKDYSKKADESKTWKEVVKDTNSAKGYSIEESINENQDTVIKWTFYDYPVSYKLPTIHYSAIIDKNVDYGQKIITDSYISSEFILNINKDSIGITPIRIGGATIEKKAISEIREKDDPIGFEIKFSNDALLTDNSLSINSIMVDILPYDDGVNNIAIDLEDYYLNNLKLNANLYDLNIEDNINPNFTFYYTLENPSIVSEKVQTLLQINFNEKNIYNFEDSFWNSINIKLIKKNDFYTISSDSLKDLMNEILDKKITAIGIKAENLSTNSTYTFSYEYDWKDLDKKIRHQNFDVIHNGVKMAVSSNVNQETFDSAISYPSISKKVVKINDIEDDNLNGAFIRTDDVITYRINYSNTTNQNTTIKITDNIPDGSSYVGESASSNGIYNYDLNQVEWIISDVEPNTLGFVEFSVKVYKNDDIKDIVNQAVVQVGENDPRLTELIINPKIILNAIKDSNPINKSNVKINDTITYTIKIKNEGIVDANNVVIIDDIPFGTIFSEVFDGGYFDKDKNNVIFNIDILKPDEEIEVKFSVKVNKENNGIITNYAIYGENNNPNTKTNVIEHYLNIDNKSNNKPNEITYNIVNTSSKNIIYIFKTLVLISTALLIVKNRKYKK